MRRSMRSATLSALVLFELVGTAAARPPPRPPGVVLEILPLRLARGRIDHLRPKGRSSWLVPCAASDHPNRQVVALLEARGYRARVVHSTSWRFEGSRLILTYAAVITPSGRLPEGFESRPVARRAVARGTAVDAPKQIAVAAVLAHALRHLAWLAGDDRAVRDGLPVGWIKALRAFRPAPFLQLR